jgi:CRISPR-associated protein Csm2
MTVETIMTKDQSGSELVTFAEQTAKTLVGNNLTRAQIRNIFTEVRKIEASWGAHPAEAMRRLNMLKPKLDYQAIRAKPVELLRDVLTQAINQVNEAKDEVERNRRFRVFMDLFEAILAYHRAKGGRTN